MLHLSEVITVQNCSHRTYDLQAMSPAVGQNSGFSFVTADGSSQGMAGKARLRHDVVLFGRLERCLAQQVLGAAHVRRILSWPQGCGCMAKTVQIDREA